MKRRFVVGLSIATLLPILTLTVLGAAGPRIFVPIGLTGRSTGYPGPAPRPTATAVASTAPRPSATAAPATATPRPSAMPNPSPMATPTPPANGETPVRGQKCPAWVHDRYVTSGPDGKAYATWHPPTDAQYGCWFGHEHGSDPRKFPAFARVGMPAFDYTAQQNGVSEPHPGFKVFVIDDHERGLWWMLTFHQGSGAPRRAFVQHHSHDVVVSRPDGTLLANVHLMADTGGTKPKCRGSQSSSDWIVRGPSEGNFKVVPTDDCTADFYESWPAGVRIRDSSGDTLFRMSASIDMDNAMTAIHRNADGTYSQTEVVPIAQARLAGADADRSGDKRQVISPRLTIDGGSGVIYTDPQGNVVATGGIAQYVAAGVSIEQTTATNYGNGWDGGDRQIYRPLTVCADSNDCNPRNMGDSHIEIPN